MTTPPQERRSDETLCTPEVVSRLCEALRTPLPLKLACERVGIHRDTYYRWRERAHEGLEPYVSLVPLVEAARTELAAELAAEAATLARVGDKDDSTKLNALKWLLERLYPCDFGSRVEVSGPEGGPVQMTGGVVILGPLGSDDGEPEPEA